MAYRDTPYYLPDITRLAAGTGEISRLRRPYACSELDAEVLSSPDSPKTVGVVSCVREDGGTGSCLVSEEAGPRPVYLLIIPVAQQDHPQ
jgi:hypothetical protein